MFCGSCMHDNTWARALQDQGAEVTLLPVYTPVRVDEVNNSDRHVFLGGINIYLDYRFPLWKKLPRFAKGWLDSPRLLQLVSRFQGSQDASQLGPLTLAMLDGQSGPLVAEMDQMVQFIKEEIRPDLICFSNALLVGILPRLKEQVDIPYYCLLQGDDIFLKQLLPEFRQQAIQLISEQAPLFDRFLLHSDYYRNYMSEFLKLDREKMDCLPLGIDLAPWQNCRPRTDESCINLGYFARIDPEKGLHNLVDAYLKLRPRFPDLKLLAGGYLNKRFEPYLQEQIRKVEQAGGNLVYLGSPETVDEKVRLFQQMDLFSVPTDYHEPKGLYLLEALASGLPVVKPDHGAFPEILNRTEGGLLAESGNPDHLATQIETLLTDSALRQHLAQTGYENVRKYYSIEAMAQQSLELFEPNHANGS